MSYVLYSVTKRKSSAGVMSEIERSKEPTYHDYLIYSKMPEIVSKWIDKNVDSYLIEAGLMIEESQINEFKSDLRKIRWKKHSPVIELMKSKLPILDDIVENNTIKENYEEAKDFFAYFFLFAGHLDSLTSLLHYDLERLGVDKNTYFDLITLDKESYTFSIVKDFGKMEHSDLEHKHPFLRTFKQKVKIEPVEFKGKNYRRKLALEKLKNSLEESDYKQIKKKSDLINDLQYICEAKNYYLDKIDIIMQKKINEGDKEWISK